MNVAEVAAYLGLHPVTVYRLVKEGRIPSFRVAQNIRFFRNDIDAAIRADMTLLPRRRGKLKI